MVHMIFFLIPPVLKQTFPNHDINILITNSIPRLIIPPFKLDSREKLIEYH